MDIMQAKVISSMEKVMPFSEPMLVEDYGMMLKNETLHFQLAYKGHHGPRSTGRCHIEVRGELAPFITIRKEQGVPVSFIPADRDDYYLREDTAVIPDVLTEFDEAGLVFPYKQWSAVWVSVRGDLQAGVYPTQFDLYDEGGTLYATLSYTVEVLDALAPKNKLRLTNWMHYDCICEWHKVKMFSPAFYRIFGEYLKAYVDTGFTMLLTPIFTPPLDTAVGAERMTAQLVSVYKTGEEYSFDFSKLKKFIRFALSHGVEYFEFSHLFTQWGGKACPKIMAYVDGEEKRIFGWDVPSDSEEYSRFLDEFFKALVAFIKDMGIKDRCYFHLTDEPNGSHFESYKNCRDAVKKHIGDMPIMDAMHDYRYKEYGYVDIPVASTGFYERFAEHNVEDLFVYNCCEPTDGYYSNRFINLPSQRTRILGMQLYQTGVKGYLHWGYNFYKSSLSRVSVDPYSNTDCSGTLPAGDGYIVYPKADGVNRSIRSENVKDGFQDYNALVLLESLISKQRVMELLEEWGLRGYTQYPRSVKAHTEFKNRIYTLIKENL